MKYREKLNRELNKRFVGANAVLCQVDFSYINNELHIRRTSRRKTRLGYNLVGKFLCGGREIGFGDSIIVLPYTGELSNAIMLGKCFVLSECDYISPTGDNYAANGNAMDFFFRNMNSPKYFPVEYRREHFRAPPSASSYFKHIEIDENVRSFVRMFVPNKYLDIYDGAYINTDASFTAILKLHDKLRGVTGSDGSICTKLNIEESDFRVILTSFIEVSGLCDISVPITFDPSTWDANPFRGASGLGADYYIDPQTGTKASNFEVYRQRIAWISHKLASGELPEDFLPPWFHIIMPKAEVRSPEVDKDKIRLIWMQNMEVGGISKHFTAPLQTALCRTYWYMPGKGLMGYMLPWMYLGLGLPHLSRFVPGYQSRMKFNEICYLLLDLSGQDMSYVGRLMFTCAFCALIMYEMPSSGLEPIVGICSYMFAWTLVKLAHFWGDKKYYTCVFASGSDWTTIFDTIMNYFCIWASIYMLCMEKQLDPRAIMPHIRIISYGDDTTISGPLWVMELLFSNLDDLVRVGRDKVGVVYKKEQSFYLRPMASHRDRFYTHIVDDEVISQGVCMLQRSWVKYDRYLNPLHPDSVDFHCVLPWRPTKDIVPKIGLDVNSWKDPRQPWIAWYQKAFGLLIDSVANRTSHNMIKSAMESVRTLYPIQVEEAESSFSWELHANVFKLGKEFDNNLIKSIPRVENSIKVVSSMFLTRQYHITTMFPIFSGHSYSTLVSGNYN